MAKVDIIIAGCSGQGAGGRPLPVPDPVPVLHEVKTSSGTSSPTTGAAAGEAGTKTNQVWVITVSGGDVRVKFGAAPVAADAADGGWLVLDGQTREFTALGGHKAAVIDAA